MQVKTFLYSLLYVNLKSISVHTALKSIFSISKKRLLYNMNIDVGV